MKIKPTSNSDKSRAGSDKSRAGSDKSRAGSDKSRAGSDESRAGSDESRAGIQRPTPNIQCQGERMHSMLDVGCWMLDVPPRQSQRGIALVITLILLSIITFMTVVFLVISTRERASVSTTTDSTMARFAVDAALERAKAQMLARILATTNDQNYDLMVSVNYINRNGFDPTITTNNPDNVNFDYTTAGNVLTPGQFLQNLANLLYDPRTMVYMSNTVTHVMENRYYLDLNRNGVFDTNGWGPVLSGNLVNPFYDASGNPTNVFSPPNVLTQFFVGDPEWIGVAEHPDQPLSSTNKLVARYAFIAIPASKTLDLNYIHNQAVNRTLGPSDGFVRNEGVGSWEINLAAFLADLNTNQWDGPGGVYQYNWPFNSANSGRAFNDAFLILSNRYAPGYGTLATVQNLYGPNGVNVFANDNIDEFSDGPLMTSTFLPVDNDNVAMAQATPRNSWFGANNTNHFFTTQDLFDQTKTGGAAGFSPHLRSAGFGSSSYDRYTFYRLLSQLGTDSAAESGKINVNYPNVDVAGNIVSSLSTNFGQWAPLQFFTTAANALLSSTFAGITNAGVIYPTNFGINYIQIYPTNQYTPAVHRLLQLAANIYDATTNRVNFVGQTNAFTPSVFRPVFFKDANANVFIAGYTEETDASGWNLPFVAANNLSVGVVTNRNVYGVPWVIGAKKGFPNFNEFDLQIGTTVSRNFQLLKHVVGGALKLYQTNQMYMLGITATNYVQVWNSYSNAFPRPLQIRVINELSMTMTNEFNGLLTLPKTFIIATTTNIPALWPGWPADPNLGGQAKRSFVTQITNIVIMPDSTYRRATKTFVPLSSVFETGTDFSIPHWWLVVTNRMRYCLVDSPGTVNERIVDFVNLESADAPFDITAYLDNGYICNGIDNDNPNSFWCTNRLNNSTDVNVPNYGIINQILGSAGVPPMIIGGSIWNSWRFVGDKNDAITKFSSYIKPNSTNVANTNQMQTPFNPTRTIYKYIRWQANDPLVHYTMNDLTDLNAPKVAVDPPSTPISKNISNPNPVTSRYNPWGYNADVAIDPNTTFNLAIKDPLVKRSDDWDFPTNKFPNVGWLGRVHRGTPWQTVYMKASDITANTLSVWKTWTGDANNIDARLVAPTNDWQLFDLFTTAINDNATRGQLSVNQSGLAAWSAVLSGVIVLTNNLSDSDFTGNPAQKAQYGWTNIQPAGIYSTANPSPVAQIVQAINNTRSATNQSGPNIGADIFPNKLFTHVGDVLGIQELTEKSPFLNTSSAVQLQKGIGDAAYERIPQQIMSLLTLQHQPRFVIYSYGQTLHPAEHSIVNSGQFSGICTNYQVTAEMATRAVVRMEGSPTNAHLMIESFNILPPD